MLYILDIIVIICIYVLILTITPHITQLICVLYIYILIIIYFTYISYIDKETSARITNTTTNTTTNGVGLSEAIAPGTGSSKNIIPLIRTTSFSRGSSIKTSSKR